VNRHKRLYDREVGFSQQIADEKSYIPEEAKVVD